MPRKETPYWPEADELADALFFLSDNLPAQVRLTCPECGLSKAVPTSDIERWQRAHRNKHAAGSARNA